jgi:hypothetical protein
MMNEISICLQESETREDFIKLVKNATGLELDSNTTLFCKNRITSEGMKKWDEM